jgi:DHA3 family macrolide efflux protein-like MFS transporter
MTSKSNKNIFFYLSSQIVSLLGSSLAQCVMFWYITLVTKSGTLMTAATIAGFIPTFIVSPFAGVWADRFDRKKLIILADALVAAATLGLFIAFRLGFQSVWLIIAVMAVRGFGQGIQQPATGAMLPQLVHPDKLMRVNSIFSSAQSAMMLISPALGGILYAAFPIEFTFGIDVITAAIAILILLLLVKVDKQKPSESTDKIGYFTDLKLGLKYVTTHKFLGRFFMYMIPSCLLTAPAAILFSLHITQKFAGDARMLALNDTAFAVGMLAGSVLMMTWGGFQRKRLTIALGFAVMSIGTIA